MILGNFLNIKRLIYTLYVIIDLKIPQYQKINVYAVCNH